ncbi:MAG: AAA family ATPase [Candidatus Cryosericum sp.]
MDLVLKSPETVRPVHVASLIVRGFKSFRSEQTVEIRPLTVLAGANSSGKSSFFQPLLLLKQTLASGSDPGTLLLNGKSVKFTELSQLFWRSAGGVSARTWSVGYADSEGRSVRQFYERGPDGELEISHVQSRTPKVTQEFRNGVRYRVSEMPADVLDALYKSPIWGLFGLNDPMDQAVPIDRNSECRVRPHQAGLMVEVAVVSKDPPGQTLWAPFYNPMQPLWSMASDMIHLPGLRGNPERDYPKRAVEGDFPGPFQDYVASIVAGWERKHDSERMERLNSWLGRLGLAKAIHAQRVNDVAYELLLDTTVAKGRHQNRAGGRVSISDVGLGVPQVLPVLVALLVAKVSNPSRLVYVEQPEIHLHPRAQSEMAKIMAEEAASGTGIVVETHSSLFLLGLQTAVAAGVIKPGDVGLHWFSQNGSGASQISRAELDRYGRAGAWPADFDDVLLEAQGQYIEAVVKASSKNAPGETKSS